MSYYLPEKLVKNPLIRELCSGKRGFSTDGVILLEESQKFDFKMRTINSDGTEVEMCGNGLRACSINCFLKLKFLFMESIELRQLMVFIKAL